MHINFNKKAKLTMKFFLLLFLTVFSLQANVYYSKVEPYETKKIASNVVGVVTKVNEDLLGKKLSNDSYIVIDSELDRDELSSIEEKIKYLKSTVSVNEKMLQNLEMSLAKKSANYDKVKKLKIKSSVEKDQEFYNLVNSENSSLATKKEINNLKIQIADLELRKAQLQRSLKDKNLKAKGYELYSLDVKVGQVVMKGTALATLADTKKAILTIYLNEEDLKNAQKNVIYINTRKTDYKIDRVLNIADSTNISKYKAQIIIKAPQVFSKLMKIELKNE